MPDTPPFYAQPGWSSLWTTMSKISDVIGLAGFCERPACRRGRCCRAESRRDLPPCIWAHRGVVRFFTELVRDSGHGSGGDPDDPEDISAPERPAPTTRPDGRDLRLVAFLRSRCRPAARRRTTNGCGRTIRRLARFWPRFVQRPAGAAGSRRAWRRLGRRSWGAGRGAAGTMGPS